MTGKSRRTLGKTESIGHITKLDSYIQKFYEKTPKLYLVYRAIVTGVSQLYEGTKYTREENSVRLSGYGVKGIIDLHKTRVAVRVPKSRIKCSFASETRAAAFFEEKRVGKKGREIAENHRRYRRQTWVENHRPPRISSRRWSRWDKKRR